MPSPAPAPPSGFDARFRPLQPASRAKLALAIVLGPVLWLVALSVVGWLVTHTDVIELGLLITLVSILVSALVLGLLRAGRVREERRARADRA